MPEGSPPLAAAAIAGAAPPAATTLVSPADRPGLGVVLRRILALAAPTTLLALVQSGSMLIETWLAAR